MFTVDWDILLGINATTLPVSIRNICNYLKVKTISYRNSDDFIKENNLEKYLENDAFSFKKDSRFTLLYDESLPPDELKIAILHEICHIVSGHCETEHDGFDGRCTTYNKVNKTDWDELEESAYKFALKLLAPACILWALKIRSAEEIEELFSIPTHYANIRAFRMEELYKREKHLLATEGRTCFLRHAKERAVYENFKPYIEKLKAERQEI